MDRRIPLHLNKYLEKLENDILGSASIDAAVATNTNIDNARKILSMATEFFASSRATQQI